MNKKSNIPVYFGDSYPAGFTQDVITGGCQPIRVTDPVKICEDVYSTGELRQWYNEQSLILDTEQGLVIITGCSHPGILNILQTVRQRHQKNIHIVFGGFHLTSTSDSTVDGIIQTFQSMGIEKCGCTHCTGLKQIHMFAEAYGDDYVPMGVGRIVRFTKNSTEIDAPEGESLLPGGFRLGQNMPNPFNGSTVIRYYISEPGAVRLTVYDTAGHAIETLFNGFQEAGDHQITWEPRHIPSGLYLYGLNGDGYSDLKKIMMIK